MATNNEICIKIEERTPGRILKLILITTALFVNKIRWMDNYYLKILRAQINEFIN